MKCYICLFRTVCSILVYLMLVPCIDLVFVMMFKRFHTPSTCLPNKIIETKHLL